MNEAKEPESNPILKKKKAPPTKPRPDAPGDADPPKKNKKSVPPPKGAPPKSAVANFRAKGGLPPPSTPPPKQSSAANEFRKAKAKKPPTSAPPADEKPSEILRSSILDEKQEKGGDEPTYVEPQAAEMKRTSASKMKKKKVPPPTTTYDVLAAEEKETTPDIDTMSLHEAKKEEKAQVKTQWRDIGVDAGDGYKHNDQRRQKEYPNESRQLLSRSGFAPTTNAAPPTFFSTTDDDPVDMTPITGRAAPLSGAGRTSQQNGIDGGIRIVKADRKTRVERSSGAFAAEGPAKSSTPSVKQPKSTPTSKNQRGRQAESRVNRGADLELDGVDEIPFLEEVITLSPGKQSSRAREDFDEEEDEDPCIEIEKGKHSRRFRSEESDDKLLHGGMDDMDHENDSYAELQRLENIGRAEALRRSMQGQSSDRRDREDEEQEREEKEVDEEHDENGERRSQRKQRRKKKLKDEDEQDKLSQEEDRNEDAEEDDDDDSDEDAKEEEQDEAKEETPQDMKMRRKISKKKPKPNTTDAKHVSKEPPVCQLFNPKNVPYMNSDLKEFVLSPVQFRRNRIVRCFIERSGSSQSSSVVYTLLLELNSSSGRPLIYARKLPTLRSSSHYVLSLRREDLFLPRHQREEDFLGKLRSEKGLMSYTLYDGGDNPEKKKGDSSDGESRGGRDVALRKEFMTIVYEKSKRNETRKMQVAIPSVTETSGSAVWQPHKKAESLGSALTEVITNGNQNVELHNRMVCFHKRETKYDALSSCIVDFKSRATCVSVKNFQLVHSRPTSEERMAEYEKLNPAHVFDDSGTVSLPQEHVMLQMGKVGADCFNMDYQYPLSMFQAFGICLSRFDTKHR